MQNGRGEEHVGFGFRVPKAIGEWLRHVHQRRTPAGYATSTSFDGIPVTLRPRNAVTWRPPNPSAPRLRYVHWRSVTEERLVHLHRKLIRLHSLEVRHTFCTLEVSIPVGFGVVVLAAV